MIHLALWLVALCVVAFFGFAILAGILHVLGSMAEGISKAFRSDKPKAPVAPTIPIGNVSTKIPGWVSAAGWVVFIAVMVGAAGLADEADRSRAAQIPGWMYIGLGLIVGGFLGSVTGVVLMREVMSSRRDVASKRASREANLQREALHARREAREVALSAYPDYLDDDILCDPEGAYAWPEDLFSRLFVVPDIVVPYAPHDGEIRLWSKIFVAEQCSDPEYVEYRAEVEHERRRRDEGLRREEERRQREQDDARAVEEAKRAEAEALAARKARQVVISVDELDASRKR